MKLPALILRPEFILCLSKDSGQAPGISLPLERNHSEAVTLFTQRYVCVHPAQKTPGFKVRGFLRGRISGFIAGLLAALCLHGCFYLQPTYTKEKAAEAVIALCRNEYGLKVNAWLSGETLYVYLPVASLTTTDKELASAIQKNINHLVVSATRVCLSMNPRMEFLVITVTDTKQHGIEYRIINYVPDLVKLQYNAISRNNFSSRSIISINQNPLAVGDEEGKYILKEPVKKADFICAQIAQNIGSAAEKQQKREEQTKPTGMMPPKAADVSLKDGRLEVTLLPLPTPPRDAAQLKEEALSIIAAVIKEYDFRDFNALEFYGLPPDNGKSEYNRNALLSLQQ
ncbi:MAG: hypothetical protein WC418_02320 [Candidatus Omnitrophota bacterium]|jgi:hypothetical protein